MVRTCLIVLLAVFGAVLLAACEVGTDVVGDAVAGPEAKPTAILTPYPTVDASADPDATATPTPVAATPTLPVSTPTPTAGVTRTVTATTPSFEYAIGTPGGTLTSATAVPPLTFNPALSRDSYSGQLLDFVFEGLIEVSRFSGEIELGLAESFEWTDDGRIWTFHLRRDVRGHDGTPFTARDVEFSFDRIIYNYDIPASDRSVFLFRFIDTNGEWQEKPLQFLLLDDYTVRFVLPTPFAPFPLPLLTPIYPRHLLEPQVDAGTFKSVWGVDSDPSEVVGTGPFTIERYVPGDRVELRRNPDYWRRDAAGNSLPYLDRIVHVIVPTHDEALAAFQAHKTDVYGMRGRDYATLEPRQKADNFTVHRRGPSAGTAFLAFNLNPGSNPETGEPYVAPERLGWFSTLEFRKAVAHSIDRERIITEVMGGIGSPQWAAFTPATGDYHNPNVPRYEYDIHQANAMLDRLRWLDRDGDGVREDEAGNPLTFTLLAIPEHTGRITVAEIIEEGLALIGIDAQLELIEFDQVLDRLLSTYGWEAVIASLSGGVDPHSGINVFHSSEALHLWHPNQSSPATEWEAELDRLFTEAGAALGHERRVELYHRAQVLIAEQLPLIYTTLSERLTATRNVFGNMRPNPHGLWDIRYLYRVGTK